MEDKPKRKIKPVDWRGAAWALLGLGLTLAAVMFMAWLFWGGGITEMQQSAASDANPIKIMMLAAFVIGLIVGLVNVTRNR